MFRTRSILAAMIGGIVLLLSGPNAFAQETVSVGGTSVVLLRPHAPRASVILMPGGDGSINAGPGGAIGRLKANQLVRTRNAYLAHGLAVLVIDARTDLSSAVRYMLISFIRERHLPRTIGNLDRSTIAPSLRRTIKSFPHIRHRQQQPNSRDDQHDKEPKQNHILDIAMTFILRRVLLRHRRTTSRLRRIEMNISAIINDTITRFRAFITIVRQIARPDRRFAEAPGNVEHIIRLAQP